MRLPPVKTNVCQCRNINVINSSKIVSNFIITAKWNRFKWSVRIKTNFPQLNFLASKTSRAAMKIKTFGIIIELKREMKGTKTCVVFEAAYNNTNNLLRSHNSINERFSCLPKWFFFPFNCVNSRSKVQWKKCTLTQLRKWFHRSNQFHSRNSLPVIKKNIKLNSSRLWAQHSFITECVRQLQIFVCDIAKRKILFAKHFFKEIPSKHIKKSETCESTQKTINNVLICNHYCCSIIGSHALAISVSFLLLIAFQ